MNKRQQLAASMVLGFACGAPIAPAWAALGHPPELEAALPQHRLLGKARLSMYGFQVYDSRLWVPPVFNTENFSNQPFALELSYLRDLKSEAIVERSLLEMRRASPIDDAKATAWRQAMLRVIPNIKKGDRVMGVNRPGEGATFWVNGKLAGNVADAEFAKLFFGIWLSPKTSQPKMRIALLAATP